MIMSKKLYLIEFVRQDTGNTDTHYVLADSIQRIEDEYSDLLMIKPLTPLEEL